MGQFENSQDAQRSHTIFVKLVNAREVYLQPHQYQDLGSFVQTCGSHTVHRIYKLLANNMGLDEYHKLMKELKEESKLNYDLAASTFVKSKLN